MPDWLAFPLLGMAWAPVLVLLHELGHALAATALTDGEVKISMRGAGMLGGSVTYESSRIRRSRDEAWIAAAGPAVTLVVGVVLWLVWFGSGATSLVTIIGAGAFSATLQFFTSALPLRYGAGLGGPAVRRAARARLLACPAGRPLAAGRIGSHVRPRHAHAAEDIG